MKKVESHQWNCILININKYLTYQRTKVFRFFVLIFNVPLRYTCILICSFSFCWHYHEKGRGWRELCPSRSVSNRLQEEPLQSKSWDQITRSLNSGRKIWVLSCYYYLYYSSAVYIDLILHSDRNWNARSDSCAELFWACKMVWCSIKSPSNHLFIL